MKFFSALIILVATSGGVANAKAKGRSRDRKQEPDSKPFFRKKQAESARRRLSLSCTDNLEPPDCCITPIFAGGVLGGRGGGGGGRGGRGRGGGGRGGRGGRIVTPKVGNSDAPGGCAEVCYPLCSEGDDNGGGDPPVVVLPPTCIDTEAVVAENSENIVAVFAVSGACAGGPPPPQVYAAETP
jgi:hypothetical protein